MPSSSRSIGEQHPRLRIAAEKRSYREGSMVTMGGAEYPYFPYSFRTEQNGAV